MNKKVIAVFISVVLTIYTLINYYIFIHGLHALPDNATARIIYTSLFSFLYISYILSRFLERTIWIKVSEPFTWIGSLWLAAMFYFFLSIILIDIIELLDYFFSFLPDELFSLQNNFKFLTAIVSCFIVLLFIIGGSINARRPIIKKLQINIIKNVPALKEINIVAVSDVHIGMLIKHRMVGRLVKMIMKLKPDIILFAGDTIDEVVEPVMKYNLGEPLKTLKAPLGIFGITGNHEFIGGIKKSVYYLESLGITMLKDEVVKIADSFYLAGRLDHDIIRFTNSKRLELEELLKDIDFSLPLILLDHQPFNLERSAQCGVDIQISGHTHHGQIWPLNFITRYIFKLSRGYKKIGSSHFYVSCGFGTWGPPVRIGNRPEVVNIKLTFQS